MNCFRAKVAVWENMIDFVMVLFHCGNFLDFLLSCFLYFSLTASFLYFFLFCLSFSCLPVLSRINHIVELVSSVLTVSMFPSMLVSPAVLQGSHVSCICLPSNCRSQTKGITHSSVLLWPRLPTIFPSLSITFHLITPTPALLAHAPVCLSTDYGAECLANGNLSANQNTSYVFLFSVLSFPLFCLFVEYCIQI